MRARLIAAAFLLTGASAAKADGDWTGFYMGAHAGYSWGRAATTDTTGGVAPGPFTYNLSGVLGGATAGYNVHSSHVLFGLEGDLGYMALKGTGLIPSSNPAAHQDLATDGGLYGALTGRLGYTFGPTLIYGKAGIAFIDASASQRTTNAGYVTNPTHGAFSGGVFGGGIEHMLWKNISIKAEYLHFNFGSKTGDQTSITDPPVGFVYSNSTKVTADSIKFGIAAHF